MAIVDLVVDLRHAAQEVQLAATQLNGIAADQAAADNRLTAIVDAFEHACDAALGQLVTETTQTLAGT
jgi:ABC-type uncharacterized transport system auxiliary subunit